MAEEEIKLSVDRGDWDGPVPPVNTLLVAPSEVSPSSTDASLSNEQRSRTPDSGPNDDFETFLEDTSAKDGTSSENETSMVEFVADDFVSRVKEGCRSL